MEILITGKLHDTAVTALQAIPKAQVIYRPDCPSTELAELVTSCQVLVTRSETAIDRSLLDRATQLKIIGRAAVGVANIDVDYASEKGILVINCPGKNTNSAAELTFALLLCVIRQVYRAAERIRNGGWDRHLFKGHELRNKRLGIVGLGNVGHRVCRFANAFDMQVYAYDPFLPTAKFAKHHAKRSDSLEQLAETVDILSVHVPLTRETTAMIDRNILQKLGKDGILINTARGKVICQKSLLASLANDELKAVAIDTWHNEPHPDPDLSSHPKVFGTPHIGASTEEAQLAIATTIAEQVRKATAGEVVDYPVNVPHSTVIDSMLHRSCAVLAEKLGSLMGQLVTIHPSLVKVRYSSELGNFPLIRLSWLKGYLHHVVDGYVSIVNCDRHCQRLGIKVKEEMCQDTNRAELQISLTDEQNNTLTSKGVVFDDRKLRIAQIDNFHFEIEPRGLFLVIRNLDRPGVVADIGSTLATQQINIGSIFLARKRQLGMAMAMIEIDTELDHDSLQRLANTNNITSVRQIRL